MTTPTRKSRRVLKRLVVFYERGICLHPYLYNEQDEAAAAIRDQDLPRAEVKRVTITVENE